MPKPTRTRIQRSILDLDESPGLTDATMMRTARPHRVPLAATCAGAVALSLALAPAIARQDEPQSEQAGDAASASASTATIAPGPAALIPTGSITLSFDPRDGFERAIVERLNQLVIPLAETTGPDGTRILDHPLMVDSVANIGPGQVVDVAVFAAPIDGAVTRGAILAIDSAIREILISEFSLNETPGLGIRPGGFAFRPPATVAQSGDLGFADDEAPATSRPDGSAATGDELLAIPAPLMDRHGERARRIWTEFFRDSPEDRAAESSSNAVRPDLNIDLNDSELDQAIPSAWGDARFDVGRFDITPQGVDESQRVVESLRDLRIRLGVIGRDSATLYVHPTASRRTEMVRVFNGADGAGTYATSAFVAIDAAVREMIAERHNQPGLLIAPSVENAQGQPIWLAEGLPAGAAAGAAGWAALGEPDAAGAERTWTLFSRSARVILDDPTDFPPLALDLVGRVAHPLIDGDPDTQRYLVSTVEFVYPDLGRPLHPELPPIDEALGRIAIPLMRVEQPAPGWIAARPGMPSELIPALELNFQPPEHLYASAGRSISLAVQQAYAQFFGWVGHFVQVDPRQVDPRRAQRFEQGDSLRFWIQSIEVDEVRTVARAENERLSPDDPTVNNPIHQPILDRSPVRARELRIGQFTNEDGQTTTTEEVIPGSIPKLRELEEFAARLNRHPGRRVDPIVTSGSAPGLVGIDYIVNEVKPWLILAEVSNTGTEETNEWRTRIGFLHTQLTNSDDIFQVDYLTAGFDESHAVLVSYQRPIIADRLWGRVYGNWSEYTASDVGLAGLNFDGESYQIGGELILNAFQHRDLFIDVLGGMRYEDVEVYNGAVDDTGEDDYIIGYLGARLERSSALASTYALAQIETALTSLDDDADILGRAEPDDRWTVFRYDASHRFFLEPLINPSGFNVQTGDPDEMTLAHEIALAARGQISFDDRLLPNEQQTAGGFFTVRGYPESLLAGDSVHVLSGEYRFYLVRSLPAVALREGDVTQPFGNFKFQRSSPYGAADWDLLFRAFADYAIVRISDANVFEQEDELFGVGIGAELLVKNNLSLRLDWGFAVNEAETATESVDEWDNRLHFSATIRF
ncbi:MAG: hypothetical protein ACTS3F_05380 [Phycisphaerales bacterium]